MNEPRLHDAHEDPLLLCAGTDPTAAARLAATAVALLAPRPATVLALWEPPPPEGHLDAVLDALYDTHADLRDAARDAACEVAQAAADVLAAGGFAVTDRVCPDDRAPWHVILDVATEIDAAVVVAGMSDRPGAPPGALGREARALAHRSSRPLLLVPAGTVEAPADAPALFAYDASPSADDALQAAARLLRPRPAIVATVWHSVAQMVGAALVAVPDDVARKGAEGLDTAAQREAASHAAAGAALLGWPSESAALRTARNVCSAIVDAVDERDAAVVVTGTRGRSRIAAALLGSNAEAIVRHAGRPVLLVPPGER